MLELIRRLLDMDSDLYDKGFKSATECIHQGQDIQALKTQAESDIHPNSFTYGWLEAINRELDKGCKE